MQFKKSKLKLVKEALKYAFIHAKTEELRKRIFSDKIKRFANYKRELTTYLTILQNTC